MQANIVNHRATRRAAFAWWSATIWALLCATANAEVVRQSDLVGWWQMGEGATWDGTAWTMPDLSGHGNTATSTRMVATDRVPGHAFDGVSGTNWAMQFDGSANRKNLGAPYAPSLVLASSYTLSAWVNKASATSDQQTVVNRCDSAAGGLYHNYSMAVHSGKPASAFRDTGVLGYPKVTANTTLTPGQWYHIAAVFDDAADAYTIYVNGSFDGQLSTLGQPSTRSSWGLYIGGEVSENTRWYAGLIDDVRVYNVPLSPAEIAGIYNGGKGDLQEVPEPSACVLLGMGALGLLAFARRCRTQARGSRARRR